MARIMECSLKGIAGLSGNCVGEVCPIIELTGVEDCKEYLMKTYSWHEKDQEPVTWFKIIVNRLGIQGDPDNNITICQHHQDQICRKSHLPNLQRCKFPECSRSAEARKRVTYTQSKQLWNLKLHIPVGSGICRTCRGQYSDALLVNQNQQIEIPKNLDRPEKAPSFEVQGEHPIIMQEEEMILTPEDRSIKRERSIGFEEQERPSKLAAYAKMKKNPSLVSTGSGIQSSGEMAQTHPEVKQEINTAAVKVLSDALQKLDTSFEALPSPFSTSSCEKTQRQNVNKFAEILDIELETLLPDATPEQKATLRSGPICGTSQPHLVWATQSNYRV